MKYICVFCGSSAGADGKYIANALTLGEELAKRGIGLVYGGSRNGTMGAVAKACLNAGGNVIGIMAAELLEGVDYHEDLFDGLTETIIAKTMPERKRMMIQKSDGFITLPGGLGTIDELTEVMNEVSCGFHHKPIGILNTDGYYDYFKKWFEHARKEKFVYHVDPRAFIYEEEPIELLNKLQEKL
jgi:uncharacterized protein (TIGR00730 family)